MKKLLIVVVALCLMSCDTQQSDLQGTHDYAGKSFPITVHVFDSQAQMLKAIKTFDLPHKPEGLAAWSLDKNDTSVMNKCDVYVVKPTSVNDHSQMTTWGHELVHCVYGTYHKEGER